MKKYCPQCKQTKDEIHFNKCKTRKNGLNWLCRICQQIHKYDRKSYLKQYRQNNKERTRNWTYKYRKHNLNYWLNYFESIYGKNPKCQICGISLAWNDTGKKIKEEVVHFDHKTLPINEQPKKPSSWFRQHKFNEKNKDIWESCNFGILCNRCNSLIPTNNRLDWLNKISIYIRR